MRFRRYIGKPINTRRGFTLVEMLVVAALIAIFAGLAVFSIQSEFERNKSKAAVAECRHIATAMHFAQQDLGFYPKLSFLKFNSTNLLQLLQGYAPNLRGNAAEIYSHAIGNFENRVQNRWKGYYMSENPDKVVRMTAVRSLGGQYFDWPADPWRNPYAVYLVATDPPVRQGETPTQRFINTSGETANYFSAVVSYGRNKMPGGLDLSTGQSAGGANRDARMNKRMFSGGLDNVTFTLKEFPDFTDPAAELDMIMLNPTVPPADGAGPRIREQGSDDRFYEF